MNSKSNEWLDYSVRRYLLDRDLERILGYLKGNVLEIGCGRKKRRGKFIPPHTSSWRYLDLRLQAAPDLCADIQDIPIKNEYADVIISLEVLEYVKNPLQAVTELRRVLKMGGSLVLSIPFMHRFDTETDFWRISDQALRYILEKAGLSVQQIYRQGGAFSVLAGVLKYIFSQLGPYRMRMFYAFVIHLPLFLLLRLDKMTMKYLPSLSTFSTGYLVLARKESK